VFLTALTLKGFKSFADSTVMRLEPGVTVVVGPNGSGKSNVVDAIAWVLGAQAPSAVRSQKMDDVIFAGTAKRPALGRAEVSLILDNTAGMLPLDVSEVSITRTLFRTGESEYAINGVSCRLLDVQELLSDAGVGRQQHVIVSQGQIDAVLNARAEERRGIIEEAAGVLKYRKRKEKAERRLDATEASLLRVQDLLREVRRQLRPLERQAEAARRHGGLVTELDALRRHVAGREITSLEVKIGAVTAQRAAAGDEEDVMRRELARLDTEVTALEAQLTARGERDVSDELRRVEQLRERARGVAAVIVERRRSLERDRGQLMDAGVVASLEGEVNRLSEELVHVERDIAGLETVAGELTEDEVTFSQERQSTLTVLEVGSGSSAASAAAEVRGELRSLTSGLERTEAELRRTQQRAASLADRLRTLDAEADRLRAECREAETVEGPLVTEVEAAEAGRLAATARAEHTAAARHAAQGELARLTARVEALELALDHARERAGSERVADLEGVLGTLLDLIEIDPDWDVATTAALGEALTAVVVSDPAAARRALGHLDAHGGTGAVLSLGAAGSWSKEHPNIGEPVRSHVRARRGAPRGVDDVLDALLMRAVRVAEWADAVDAAMSAPDAIVVTERGDRFVAGGWRLGVGSGAATAAALEQARVAAHEARVAAETAVLTDDEARRALEAARSVEQEVVRRLDANDARFTGATEGLSRVHSERREVAGELDSLQSSIVEVESRTVRDRERAAELAGLLPALQAEEEAEVAASRARGEARARLEARAALLASRRRDLEVRSAGLHERQQLLERRREEAERRLAADAQAREAAAQRREQVDRSLVALVRLAGVIEHRRAAIETRHQHLLDVRRRQSDEARAVAIQLEHVRGARSSTEKSLEGHRERLRRLDVELAEARLRLESAIETVRRDLDIEPAVAQQAPLPELPDGVTPAARIRDLERELRLLGPINPLALEEFNELQERHRFLEEQLEDVRTTRRELMRVIRAVDGEIQSTFAAAYADVSQNFQHLFATLFPGGTGRLVLTNPDDLLATGVEVEARPGGKNVKKLSLLSGGERSLTALAFLFAVFRSRPSPFYVMDEVEAALDDVNLHRFLQLIDEFRREAQLVIVSHQKRTMEAADSLLGVSMQPGGSSKVVVERVGTRA
jgi:chromosome segregation protein